MVSLTKHSHFRLINVGSLTLCLLIVLGLFVSVGQAHAFSPNYNPSNLIDNPTLTNNAAMSAQDIQFFLTNLQSGLAGYSDAEACSPAIAPYYTHCGQTLSAAQLIYDAGQAYGVNPRAILATMEKEQSLVTDPTPSASQINCAMGYNSCSNYVGFFTQVDNGTWALRYNYEGAMQHATWLSWSPGANYPCSNAAPGFYSTGLYPGSTVVFDDSGGTAETVTLANAATASLYCYTPYVGPHNVTGYSGSYNFVYYFQLWFGSTQTTTAYAWDYDGQNTYADSGYSIPFTDGVSIAPGQKAYFDVYARNTGYQTWSQSVVHLGTDNPEDRLSSFANSSWLSANRIAMQQSSVIPGNTATFQFSITAPSTPGSYREYFNLVADGTTWMNDLGLYFPIDVVVPRQTTNTQNTGLNSGQSITMGQYLLSGDTQSTLNMQSDGNVVLYSNYKPVWSSNTSGTDGNHLTMQADGNLVEYDSSGKALWDSATEGNPGSTLALQTDGNLVIYSASAAPLWSTGTVSIPNHLDRVNETLNTANLFPQQVLQTANGDYTMILQTDGNLVLYQGAHALWDSGTVNQSVVRLAMQSDGNLVLYNTSGQAVWNTHTNGQGPSYLTMQGDGNLVMYNSSGTPTWASNTAGQ
jgi:hypothetical protein